MAYTKRSTMQIFPTSFQNLWKNWELRVFVVLSLSFQIILTIFGNKRKHCTIPLLRLTLWSSYLLADWIAMVSLGVLSNKEGENEGDSVDPKYVIISLWAPLLLLHLGGSDTITAYSMEDNELWNRRSVSFFVQGLVAIYIFLRAWTNTYLNILAIPLLIAGIMKMGERIWILRSASSQQFKESLFPKPDAGPNYARYMEAYISASQEGFKVDVGLIEAPSVGDHTYAASEGNLIPLPQTNTDGHEAENIAHNFLKIFKPLFADLILSFHDVLESRLSLQNGDGLEVFELMEIELGFMHDLFYTKAAVIYSFMGSFLRFFSFSCNVSVLCAFFLTEKNQYPKVDVFITYVLILGAIILEIYSVVSMLFSDWTKLWLSRHKNKVTTLMKSAISSIRRDKPKRWSRTMGQFNLIKFCLKANKQRCSRLHKFLSFKVGLKYRNAFLKISANCCFIRVILGVYQFYQKFNHYNNKKVTDDLKNIIFKHFTDKINRVNAGEGVRDEVSKEIKRFCDDRGKKVLERFECYGDLEWSLDEEFDKSILLWHIATDLLCDDCVSGGDADNGNREASQLLSDYMLYLLVMRPSMLPNGIGEIRFQDTCAEAAEFVKDRKFIKKKKEACEMLRRVSRESEKVLPSEVKGDRSKSVLFDGCRLAIKITKLRDEEDWEREKMWELIAQVWVEMLAYAACHCQWIHHAQQLRHGGELLTHVWLLMAHLGITDQFQISKGHARTKLIRQ